MKSKKAKAPVFLLGLGNRKLGEAIYTFTLPAVQTCPGRSKLCEKVCYALRGRLRLSLDSGRYESKYQASLAPNFADRMTREIQFRRCSIVRVHVGGDFYSPEYTKKWAEIVKRCPQTRFFAYTRSWRIAEIRKELDRLARLPNIRVWFSCDRDTGWPTKVGKRIRIAYMAADDNDVPAATPDLVFRVKRKTVVKKIGSLVCPMENGSGAKNHTNCQKCGLCWEPLENKDPRRYAIPLVATKE